MIAGKSPLYLLALACNFLFSLEAAISEYGTTVIAVSLKATPMNASAFLFWYFLAISVGVSFASWLSHRVQPDRALLAVFGMASVLAFLGSCSESIFEFALVRIGIGILQANMVVFLGTLIVRNTPPQVRGNVFSATGVGIGLGYFTAPFSLTIMLHFGWGWRYVYAATGLGMLLLLPFFWRMQRLSHCSAPYMEKSIIHYMDLLSIVFLSGVLCSGAMLLHPSSPFPSNFWRIVLIVLCFISIWGTYWSSKRCDIPALDVQLINHSGTGPFLLACILSFFATYLVAFVAPYLAFSMASTWTGMGVFLLVAFPIGFALGSAVAGRIVIYLGPGCFAFWSHVGCAVAAFVGAALILLESQVWLAMAYLAGGTMRGATIAPMSSLVALQVPLYRLPSLLSISSISRSIGMLLGVAVAAHMWNLFGLDAIISKENISHANILQFSIIIYMLAAVLQSLAALLLVRYKNIK